MDAAAQAAVGPGVMFSLPTFSGNVMRRSATSSRVLDEIGGVAAATKEMRVRGAVLAWR